MRTLFNLFSLKKIGEIFQQPSSHPQEFVLLIGIFVFLTLAFLALFGLIFLRPPRKEKEAEKKTSEEEKARERLITLLVSLGLLTIILFVFFRAATSYTSRSSFCSNCHNMKKDSTNWAGYSHQKMPCISCHQEPGVVGFLTQQVKVTHWLLSYQKDAKKKRYPKALITSNTCRQCHNKLLWVVTFKGIRVSHREFLESIPNCLSCHPEVNHSQKKQFYFTSVMNRCIRCHNGEQASGRCTLCHLRGIARGKTSLAGYPKVSAGEVKCSGCHSKEECFRCHPLDMPHSEDWKEKGKHALEGFINKKVCWQCHDVTDCRRCHEQMPRPYPEDWPKTHAAASRAENASCRSCHDQRFCSICHAGVAP